MGFRLRKSITLLPGVRMNFSKTGIGFSAGVKGYRVTKRADGRGQRTLSLPGTGISHVTTSGTSRRKKPARARVTAAPARGRAIEKPGFFAPKDVKDLYEAVREHDIATMERLAQTTELAVAASTLAGVLLLSAGNKDRAQVLLDWVFSTGKDPAHDHFIEQYARASVTVAVVAGVTARLPLDRDCVGLLLAELDQQRGDLATATAVVEHLQPTTITALSLAELYAMQKRWDDVIEITNNVSNEDDATATLCTFRGVALREQGLFDAARGAFREALKSKQRTPIVRHRALLERARCYEAEGKHALARKDLERIMAEDASYPGLQRAVEALRTRDEKS